MSDTRATVIRARKDIDTMRDVLLEILQACEYRNVIQPGLAEDLRQKLDAIEPPIYRTPRKVAIGGE